MIVVKIEKKLLAYCAIAVMIGIASITPLIFLMSGTAKAETTVDKPWFNLYVPYAYWTGNYSENSNGTASYSAAYNESWDLVLNATLTSDAAVNQVDARFEYYQMQIYSDEGPIANLTYFFEINSTGNISPNMFNFERDNWFNTNTTGGITEGAISNVTKPQLNNMNGFFAANSSSNSSLPDWFLQDISGVKDSETTQSIFIDLRRLGWITFEGNSTVVTRSSSDVLQHIELMKFGDGFLYNNLIPEDHLSQTNLLAPLETYYQHIP